MRGNERIAFFFVKTLQSLANSESFSDCSRDAYSHPMASASILFLFLIIKNVISHYTHYQVFIRAEIQNQSGQYEVVLYYSTSLLLVPFPLIVLYLISNCFIFTLQVNFNFRRTKVLEGDQLNLTREACAHA